VNDDHTHRSPGPEGGAAEVFRIFLRLGLTAFGGPIAHLGYFRQEFVARRRWLSEDQYAQLLALCQFLPGPASSQVGFGLGLVRAGWLGALAAFVGFTLPSAALLFAFAVLVPGLSGDVGTAVLHGLKLVALVVVAQALLGMSRQLCPDIPRATLAVLATVLLLVTTQAWMQVAVIVAGGLVGALWLRNVAVVDTTGLRVRHGAGMAVGLLSLFLLLLVGLPLAAVTGAGLATVVDAFYRAGALVFGGGHVVLPLLEEAVVSPGWVGEEAFLAGYGAAQAVPGPMFAIASYLGALLPGANGGLLGATMATLAIFLPGFLLLAGVLPFWSRIVSRPSAARAVAGVNAAVVGLLAAAFYDPIWVTAIRHELDLAIALIGFLMAVSWRLSPLLVVLWCLVASAVTTIPV